MHEGQVVQDCIRFARARSRLADPDHGKINRVLDLYPRNLRYRALKMCRRGTFPVAPTSPVWSRTRTPTSEIAF